MINTRALSIQSVVYLVIILCINFKAPSFHMANHKNEITKNQLPFLHGKLPRGKFAIINTEKLYNNH